MRSDKPVVVVGSMRNPSTLGYEGAANLLEGFRVAASPEATRQRRAGRAERRDQRRARSHQDRRAAAEHVPVRGYGILGVVDADRVVFYRSVVKRNTAKSEFDIATVTRLPRVDVIMTYQGADGDLIKAAVDNGAKGIVLAGGRRRRDQRHAAGRHRLRAEEGRLRRDDDPNRKRAHRAADRTGRTRWRSERDEPERADARGTAPPRVRRRSIADQSACAVDARPDENQRPGGNSTHVFGVLRFTSRARSESPVRTHPSRRCRCGSLRPCRRDRSTRFSASLEACTSPSGRRCRGGSCS